jgi:N-acetylmuramoyl-L-alanine amidase
MFARVSPFFILLSFSLGSLPSGALAASSTANAKHQAAVQFERAEQQRAALNARPVAKRTLAEYRQVVTSYRRVSLITSHASQVPDSLFAVSQLYAEMGERFGRNYYQSAVDSYRFLLREYPASKYGPDATLVCAKIQRDQLGDNAGATRMYQDFLKRYPHSSRKHEAQEGIAELAMLQNSAAPTPVQSRATPTVAEPSLPSDDGDSLPQVSASASSEVSRLRRIRASATDDTARITIDLEGGVQYTSGRLKNPDRIFFDLHAARLTPEVAHENVQVDGELLTAVRAAQNHADTVRVVLDVNGVKEYAVSTSDNPPQLLIDLFGKSLPPAEEKTAKASHSSGSAAPNFVARTDNSSAGVLEKASAVPQPTHEGQSTLTRALGLKIGRIVIDPGHGGHDTGTIGPTGLMEKDLCLDVALRLGKIIKQRLPGAEVVFTRSDDSFIPLEERTAIANEAHADLFVSIHANSSQDHGARGIETYYLNLKGSPEAMEVAARENAVSNVGIHDLEDLIKKIARNEKIDESREFAEDIQNSLSQRVQKTNKTVKNRGVRKAPFVVLIGANMPSILTEISFLSNPADEQLLKKPENRQRVAEGLYQGVASYLQSLNSVTLNMPPRSPAKSSSRARSAKLEQSRNAQ